MKGNLVISRYLTYVRFSTSALVTIDRKMLEKMYKEVGTRAEKIYNLDKIQFKRHT